MRPSTQTVTADLMSTGRASFFVAIALSLVLHAGLLAGWRAKAPPPDRSSKLFEPLQVSFVASPAHPKTHAEADRAKQRHSPLVARHPRVENEASARVAEVKPPTPAPEKTLASMPAPTAPTAEEWKLASTYTLKNSKRYRYTWAQQVRSMMGTAVEGPQQGMVRLHIEITPDGKLAKAEVLWSTSETTEKLALQAIRSLPPLPPTPTGQPLVFDKTIAFIPYETGWPPLYRYDCVPDPQSFHNPFAQKAQPTSPGTPTSRSTERSECPDTGADSIEAEEQDMQRQFKEWGAGRLNGVE